MLDVVGLSHWSVHGCVFVFKVTNFPTKDNDSPTKDNDSPTKNDCFMPNKSRFYNVKKGGYGTWAWAAHSPERFAAVRLHANLL